MMNKYDLTDITFLIPVRIDSTDRISNLHLVIEYIKNHFDTAIFVLEADVKEYVYHKLIDRKIFIKDQNSVFHRTKYLNKLTEISNTPIIAIWDTDILISPNQILEAVNLLRRKWFEMILPYDGRFYNTPALIKELFKSHRNLDVFTNNIGKFPLAYGAFSVGGAFIVNRKDYIMAGKENEKFFGWGPEDMERVKRWDILGFKFSRISGPLFHLYHTRGINSGYTSLASKIAMHKELVRICKLDKETLEKEVGEWYS